MKNTALLILAFLLFVGNGAFCQNSQKNAKGKPNIIFLLTDDQRFDALGCMGNTEIQTPNIDKLAEQGTIFMNNYNATSICMGARAVIMTGMYEHKTGCNFSHGPLTREKFAKSYPVLLREAGYYTGFTGKFGYAVKESAEENTNYKTNDAMPIDQFDWWKGWPGQGYYNTIENEFLVEYAEEYPHVSEALGAASVDFIKEASGKDEPFCLSVSFKAPHDPASPDPQYNHVYEDKTFTKPENWGENGAQHLPVHPKLGRQYQKLRGAYHEDRYDASLRKYYQLMYGVDVAVGMIIQELEQQGLMDNTIIIYTTDNGYFNGSHDFGGKVLVYEEGSRAPLIIYDPSSTIKGQRIEPLTGTHDLAPTMLDYAGVDIPENMDGVSLVPIMDGSATKVKDHMMINNVWGINTTHCLSVLKDHYKYIYWYYADHGLQAEEEMYNLKDDPQEMNNLATDENASDKLEEMRLLYDAYVEKWKNECTQVVKNNYIEYGVLFDRHKSWAEKVDLVNGRKEPDTLAIEELLEPIDTSGSGGPTGMNMELEEEDVEIGYYPNPTNDKLTVNFNHQKIEDVQISLYTIRGKLVANLFAGLSNGTFNETFDVKEKSGVYILNVSIGEEGNSGLVYIN